MTVENVASWFPVKCAACVVRYGERARPVLRVEVTSHPVPRVEVRRRSRSGPGRWVDVEHDGRNLAMVVACDHGHCGWGIDWRGVNASVVEAIRVGASYAVLQLAARNPARARRTADSLLSGRGQ